MSTIDLRLGDCLEVMRDLPDGSVDLVVTSPPYDNLRKYGTFDFEQTAQQLVRVIKKGGVIVWVVADQTVNGSETGTSFKQALHFKALGLNLHDTMIFGKMNHLPLNHNRYEPAFEYMFVLSKGKPKTVSLLTEPCKHGGVRKFTGKGRHNLHDLTPHHGVGKPYKLTKIRENIWFYPVGGSYGHGHPAPFPLDLATDHVLSWSNPGDVVLDCFLGSGTTGVACINTGRNFIGIERDAGYFQIATERIHKAQEAGKQLELAV